MEQQVHQILQMLKYFILQVLLFPMQLNLDQLLPAQADLLLLLIHKRLHQEIIISG